MIKPPSVQNEYTLIYSGDPALRLPVDEDERKHALELARETGDWSALLGDEPPTKFYVRPLFGEDFNYWQGESTRRGLTTLEASVLALQLTLRKIENLDNIHFKIISRGERAMLDDKTISSLYKRLGDEAQLVILELANTVIQRAAATLRPKS